MVQKLSEIGVNKFIIYKPELCDQSIAKKDLEKIIQKSKDIINDPKKLKNVFEDLYFNMDNRVNYIQKVFQQINSKYSLSVIKQRIKEL